MNTINEDIETKHEKKFGPREAASDKEHWDYTLGGYREGYKQALLDTRAELKAWEEVARVHNLAMVDLEKRNSELLKHIKLLEMNQHFIEKEANSFTSRSPL